VANGLNIFLRVKKYVSEESIRLSTGLSTIYRKWIPLGEPRAIIVGVHGFAEHTGRYHNLGNFLAQNGYALYMYDLRGHGKSQGEKGYIDKFENFVEDTVAFFESVKTFFPEKKVFLLGHSMGGLIAVHTAGVLGDKINGLITSGAAVQLETSTRDRIMVSLMSKIAPKSRVKLPVKVECLSTDPEVGKRYIEDPLVLKEVTMKLLFEFSRGVLGARDAIQKIRVPALVMHGSRDCLVPVEASKMLFEGLGVQDKTLKIYDGMLHEIFNEVEKEKVFRDLADWLSKHV
jgi:Lysophospholipase